MLQWLAENVSVFKIQHDAHREFHMTVEQHLQNRRRIGDAPAFCDARDRETCVMADRLWELRVILDNGATYDIAGSSLESCIRTVKGLISRNAASLAA